MKKERKELAERKTRLQEIFDETRALGDYNPFDTEQADEARTSAQEDARETVVDAFRRFHNKHHGRLRRKELLNIFAEAAKRMQ